MYRFLLDTHAFVWLTQEPGKLSQDTVDEITDLVNEVFVSAVTFWEIAMNRDRGRMRFSGSISEALRIASFTELPITGAHCEVAVNLPGIHRAPFDRLLLAQAQTDGLILVTHDRVMSEYNVAVLRV